MGAGGFLHYSRREAGDGWRVAGDGFKRSAARRYVVIGAFGALHCVRLWGARLICHLGLCPGLSLGV